MDNKKCQRLQEDIEMFGNLASHSLKSPLNVISTYCDMLEEHIRSNNASEEMACLTSIRTHNERMRQMIVSMFDYIAIELGSSKPLTKVDTTQIIKNIISNLNISDGHAPVRITYDPLPPVMAREKLLAAAFGHLIDNAIKFRGKELPVIHITVRDSTDNMVEFAVSDNGIGIEEEFHETIFQLFQTLHPQEEYPGLGAGLALTKKIIECSGGTIWVESTGPGTTFLFTLQHA